ncbi:ParB N-terminal domain-containing protein [Aurantimonas sp. VKM B-3413]|uniref:ParB N-terminal domain-containing protein n=1 Tax=Aurantimonas sp. VKM B-3413 TaxID=2779401 RepID=UPI001E382E06|nr:ParB N-terminal domain-containing protein [Aurantimonas sp. VKM B-3413]MCB8835971.1 ParB N-terminal domain-containing protein [Aurantimonas sp. VKM B-3413]
MTDQATMRRIEVAPGDRPAAIDPGPAPMLQWIDIAALVVDEGYQRELKRGNWTAIRRIAGQFKWSRFSPVFVAPIEGGRFAVIDGQHRTHAAAMCGFAQVPCQVVPMEKSEQAASFAAVNGLVTKVTKWQIFKAALSAGEKWAVSCDRAVSEAGCHLMTRHGDPNRNKSGEIYPVALIHQYVRAKQADVVTASLGAIRRSEFGREAAAYTNEIVKPLLAAVADRPWLISQDVDLAGFLDDFDVWSALDRAAELTKQKRRQGVTGVSRYDFAAAEFGEGLDRAFPQRMALPAPEKERAA